MFEGFIRNAFKRVRDKGPLAWSENFEHPISGITISERSAMRECIKRGLLVVDYDARDNLVIRAPMYGPPAPPPKEATNGLPYLETPALLALRERRRRLGR